jgi:hypothetical protein
MSAADRIMARMVAEGDSSAAAYVRLCVEDGSAPVVEWDRAVFRLGNASREARWKAIRDAAQTVRTTTHPFLRRAKVERSGV